MGLANTYDDWRGKYAPLTHLELIIVIDHWTYTRPLETEPNLVPLFDRLFELTHVMYLSQHAQQCFVAWWLPAFLITPFKLRDSFFGSKSLDTFSEQSQGRLIFETRTMHSQWYWQILHCIHNPTFPISVDAETSGTSISPDPTHFQCGGPVWPSHACEHGAHPLKGGCPESRCPPSPSTTTLIYPCSLR